MENTNNSIERMLKELGISIENNSNNEELKREEEEDNTPKVEPCKIRYELMAEDMGAISIIKFIINSMNGVEAEVVENDDKESSERFPFVMEIETTKAIIAQDMFSIGVTIGMLDLGLAKGT